MRRRSTLVGRKGQGDGSGGTGGAVWRGGKRTRRVTRDWSSLPDPALHLILEHMLPSVQDFFSFGGVCKGWWSVFTAGKRDLFSALPLLVDHGSSPDALGGFYNLMERRSYRRRQPIAWPWMPPWTSPYNNPKWLSDLWVIGVSHGFWIVRPEVYYGGFPFFLINPLSPEVRIRLPPARVDNTSAFLTAPPTSPDCVVVATMAIGTLCYCRLGDTEWTEHSFKEGDDVFDSCGLVYRSDQLAVLDGKVYALARSGKLVIMELLFPRPSVTVVEVKGLPRERDSWVVLVESDGEILCVEEVGGLKLREEHEFVVRRLDLPARKCVTLSTLGDRTLFLKHGAKSLSCVAARRWGGRDRIYSFCCHSKTLVVFHMKDGSVEHLPLSKKPLCCNWVIPSFCHHYP